MQNFVYIPYTMFLQNLRYHCERVGIHYVEQEESYTSKASFLDGDFIPTYGKDDENPIFSGKRIYRGLYRSANGTYLNADVNGSCNIGRKAYPDLFKNVKDFSYLNKKIEVWNFDKWYQSKKIA